MRIRLTVRTDQPIVAEVEVAGVKTVEIAAISIDHHPVLAFPAARLVNEVPNESTLVFRIFAYQIPILLEASLRITHGMSIFTLNQRLGLAVILTILDTVFIIIIHRAENVCLSGLMRLLILHRTA